MCGIVGYTGYREAYPILIKGLHRLEYRGYDSAGVALLDEKSELNIYKAQGKVSDLEASTRGKSRAGSLGIAHTRWATHGLPTENNAHPHISESGRLTLVHNGIIENYKLYEYDTMKNEEAVEEYVEEQCWTHPVDVVFSHPCPYKYVPTECFLPGIDQSTVDNSTEHWLDTIEEMLDYKAWYLGHWHINKRIDKLHFLMHDVEMLID